MISAATASTAVLMTSLVRDHGVQHLFAATIHGLNEASATRLERFAVHRRTAAVVPLD
jgi:hypothetical protein